MTKKELHDYGIDIDKQFEQAEKEHEKEVDEATDMITAEDIVEQAVYMANAPECCIENTDLGNAYRFAMHERKRTRMAWRYRRNQNENVKEKAL